VSGAPVAANASQSPAPPKPFVSVTVAGLPGPTLDALTLSTGGGAIVNVSADDVPPPGGGVVTRTDAVPTEATSLARIDAVSFVLLITCVDRAAPFHCSCDDALKPLPVTVRVNAPDPARVEVGDNVATVGGGLEIGTSVLRASKTRTRGTVSTMPRNANLLSVMGRPVLRSAFNKVVTLAAGTACFRMAHEPATCGAAIDVPLSAP
jgi:hypothetical protein